MSSRDLYRQPTWTGLGPPRLRPRRVPVDLARRIATAIAPVVGGPGRLSALRATAADSGLFRFDRKDGARFIVKRVARARCRSLIAADDLARWLHDRGMVVALPCPGSPVELADGTWAFVHAEIDGARPPATPASLTRLGREIAGLHRVLRNHPDRGDWARATRQRMQHLSEIRRTLAEGSRSAGPQPDALAGIAARRELEFDDDPADAVPLHGDLNPGNLLRRRGDGRIAFLDLEDVCHSVLPPAYELALVAERMATARDIDDARAATLISSLYRGYREGDGAKAPPQPREAPQYLQGLALRSLCVLADAEWSGIAMPQREWAKFFTLFDLADRRRGAFEAAA